jgi:hypothetical protein
MNFIAQVNSFFIAENILVILFPEISWMSRKLSDLAGKRVVEIQHSYVNFLLFLSLFLAHQFYHV